MNIVTANFAHVIVFHTLVVKLHKHSPLASDKFSQRLAHVLMPVLLFEDAHMLSKHRRHVYVIYRSARTV